jgi:uncharacterized DUF497 family protein
LRFHFGQPLAAKFDFEWDDAKAQSNLRKHGISFDLALFIFAVPECLEVDVSREIDGERRMKRTGPLRGVLTAVVFTQRGARYRLISARRANKGEEKRYGNRASPD